jgi:hypothetical protein
MTKLKTLNEIPVPANKDAVPIQIDRQKIREEVIKWEKCFKKEVDEEGDLRLFSALKFITDFFNLTSRDLK